MVVAFVVFVALLVLGRDELGLRGIATAIIASLMCLAVVAGFGGSAVLSVAGQAIIDVVLVLVVFGGDVKIR